MTDDQMALMIPIIAVGGAFLTAIIAVITKAITRMMTHSQDVHLKSRLVDAGMDAEEIEHVINAGRWEQNGKGMCRTRAKRTRQDVADHMIQQKPIAGKPPVHV